MRLEQFLAFDAIGAALYIGAYALAGYIFSDALRAITRGLRSAGFAAEVIFAIGLAAYIAYRIWIYRKYRLLDVAPRVHAEDLARRLAAAAPGSILIADVRSHGYYDAESERIAGSIRIEPNRSKMKSRTSPRSARFISTALERAKPPAPVWRICCKRRIQSVRHSRRPARLAQSRPTRRTSPNRRCNQAADVT